MFNTAFMGLSELFERGDPKRCFASFLSLFLFSWTSLLIFAAFALFCNGIFVSLWTHKQIAFPMACTWVIFTWLILASLIRALACFSNVWQHRTTMRISPILEFSSLCVFLGVSLLSPSLFFFSLALAASQIPPLFLSYGPFILAAGKILEIHLSKNQWGMIFTAVISFFIAILTLLMPVSLIPAILIISFSALPWIYFFSRELKSGALTRQKSILI
jgi:hypothetical protein